MTPAITVDGLTVTHGSRTILRSVQLRVARSARLVLTGSNGAGKSTLLSAIAGVRPANGVQLFNQPNTSPAARAGLSWCAGGGRLPEAWTARELLGLRSAQVPSAPLSTVTDPLGLDPLLDQRIDTLSAGERQRVALALALLGPPTVTLLDEPLEHLDAPGRASVITMVDDLADTTFVIATHRPEDWQATATQTLRLHNGALESL